MRFLPLVPVLALLAGPAAAAEKIWSYDPADAGTRAFVDNGLTFHFNKGVFGFRVIEVFATQGQATAKVEPADERDLGGSLERILPPGAFEREIYAVLPEQQGAAMVHAFCPGSTRGWLVFGPLRDRKGVTVHALGDNPAGGPARLCATLNFTFRGAWELPTHGAGVQGPPPTLRTPF